MNDLEFAIEISEACERRIDEIDDQIKELQQNNDLSEREIDDLERKRMFHASVRECAVKFIEKLK